MAGKPKPMSQIKQLLRLHKQGISIKRIARDLNLSRNTVKAYLSKLPGLKVDVDALLLIEDPALEAIFLSGNPAYKDPRFDYLKDRLDYIAKELGRTGVTRHLLWEEYCQQVPESYSYSQFCFHLGQHLIARRPSMVLEHKPADKLFIDFAGKKLNYTDYQTGEVVECQVFVACLPYSDYAFAMAVRTQNISDFIYALSCCLQQLGGVPVALVPDNLKAAITKASAYEPDVNQALEDFANHHQCVVYPARVRKPKDKALVENQVKLIYNRVYARLRNQQFLSLDALNQAIKEKTRDHNQTRMQQKLYSREENFLANEKNLLSPLPDQLYQIKFYKILKVAKNNHIYITQDKHYYSVPYQYIGKKVRVIYTRSLVRIYLHGKQIAIHQRSNQTGYTTDKTHLCSAHQHYLDRSPDYYKNKAKAKSVFLLRLFEMIFDQDRYPEQLYRTCDGFLQLYNKTPEDLFNKACQLALEHQNYSYQFLFNLLSNKMLEDPYRTSEKSLPKHANVRGKQYFIQSLIPFETCKSKNN